MKGINNKRLFVLLPSVIMGVLVVVTVISAATTISTNIQTDGTLNVTSTSTLLGETLAQNIGGKTWYFAAGLNGAVCNDATDDTSAFNALLTTVYNAGGGTIHVDGTCLISGAVLFPNNGGTFPNLTQPTIRIAGAGTTADGDFSVSSLPSAPSALDLRYNASVAKLDTRGYGKLEIDHVALVDGGTDCAPFIQTTNTTLDIHDVVFSGTASGTSACNDAIVLGGTSGNYDGTATANFQGYGTVIENNWFNKIQRAVFARNDVNGIQILNNTVSLTSGSASHGAFEFWNGGVKWDNGNYISGNLIEMGNYKYAVWFSTGNAWGNVMTGNSLFDWDTPNTAGYRFESGASNNTVIDSWNENHTTPFSQASGASNTYITSNGSPGSAGGTSIFTNPMTIGNGLQAGGLTINGGATTTGNAYFAGALVEGTSTPTFVDGSVTGLLLVGNTATDTTLEIHNEYAQGIDVFTHSSSANWKAPTINLNRSRGTQSSPTSPLGGDILGTLDFGGYDGSHYYTQALIQSGTEGNYSTTNTPAYLSFQTNSAGSSNVSNPVERMRITGSGSVGIATTSPVANFQVANGINATTTVEFGSTGQNKGSCLKLYRTDGSAIYAYVAAGATTFTLTTTVCASVSNF